MKEGNDVLLSDERLPLLPFFIIELKFERS